VFVYGIGSARALVGGAEGGVELGEGGAQRGAGRVVAGQACGEAAPAELAAEGGAAGDFYLKAC
jgi:hypothetical protein